MTSLLTSLFPSGMIVDLARERDVVVRDRKLDVRVLVWTLVVDFAVGGEARSIAGYHSICKSEYIPEKNPFVC